jgi:hypothetical protein
VEEIVTSSNPANPARITMVLLLLCLPKHMRWAHSMFSNSKQGSCVLNSKTSKPQTRHQVNRYYWAGWNLSWTDFSKIYEEKKMSTSSSKNLQIEQKYSPMRTPQFSHTCRTSCSWLQSEHITCVTYMGFLRHTHAYQCRVTDCKRSSKRHLLSWAVIDTKRCVI